jgi:hypothetical protein
MFIEVVTLCDGFQAVLTGNFARVKNALRMTNILFLLILNLAIAKKLIMNLNDQNNNVCSSLQGIVQ